MYPAANRLFWQNCFYHWFSVCLNCCWSTVKTTSTGCKSVPLVLTLCAPFVIFNSLQCKFIVMSAELVCVGFENIFLLLISDLFHVFVCNCIIWFALFDCGLNGLSFSHLILPTLDLCLILTDLPSDWKIKAMLFGRNHEVIVLLYFIFCKKKFFDYTCYEIDTTKISFFHVLLCSWWQGTSWPENPPNPLYYHSRGSVNSNW